MTLQATRNIARRLARQIALETMSGKPKASTDRRLKNLFEAYWDRWKPGPSGNLPITFWFDRDEYMELRRQLLLSGEQSLHRFIKRRLRLATAATSDRGYRKAN